MTIAFVLLPDRARSAALSGGRPAAGLYLVWVIVNGFSLDETQAGRPHRIDPDLAPAVSDYIASLPGEGFPNLVALADEFAKQISTGASSC